VCTLIAAANLPAQVISMLERDPGAFEVDRPAFKTTRLFAGNDDVAHAADATRKGGASWSRAIASGVAPSMRIGRGAGARSSRPSRPSHSSAQERTSGADKGERPSRAEVIAERRTSECRCVSDSGTELAPTLSKKHDLAGAIAGRGPSGSGPSSKLHEAELSPADGAL
jgi:hypothetical protein